MERKIRFCKIHGETEFAKHKNGNAKPSFKCCKCSAEATKRVVDAKKERAYLEFGSSCVLCGYSKCKRALEWHHLDPSTKEVNPTKVFSRKWERIVEELSKCVLLCANCHREVHDGISHVPEKHFKVAA